MSTRKSHRLPTASTGFCDCYLAGLSSSEKPRSQSHTPGLELSRYRRAAPSGLEGSIPIGILHQLEYFIYILMLHPIFQRRKGIKYEMANLTCQGSFSKPTSRKEQESLCQSNGSQLSCLGFCYTLNRSQQNKYVTEPG